MISASPRRWWVLLVLVAGVFMFVVDAFVVNVALPTIRRDLNASAGTMEAVIAVYQVAYAATVITGGRLGDLFGRRRLFVIGVLGFTLVSLWCGLARSGAELVLARLVQGAAAALLMPQVLATIHVLFPDAGRSRAFAIYGAALGLGGAIGVAAGGALVTFDPFGFGWRAIFLINLPIGLAIAGAALALMPNTPRRDQRLDLTGAAILLMALLGLICPLLAGHTLGWPAWLLDVAIGGGALFAAFLRFERRIERRGRLPLVPLALLSDRHFLQGLATVTAFQMGNISFYLLVTLYLQGPLGWSPLASGLAVVPLALAFTLAAQLAGKFLPRTGLRLLQGGAALQGVGLLALAAMPPEITPILGVLALFGFGQGLVMAPLPGLVLATVGQAQAGSASGIVNTVHQAAGALGVAIVGASFATGGMTASLVFLLFTTVATLLLLEQRRRRAHGAVAA